jgi:hypothetical protein
MFASVDSNGRETPEPRRKLRFVLEILDEVRDEIADIWHPTFRVV